MIVIVIVRAQSPAVMKGWQRRFFVMHTSGEVFYFTDPSKEKKKLPAAKGGGKETKQRFLLSDCSKFTSENKEGGQFDVHFAATGKVMQLRVEARTAAALQQVQEVLHAMKRNGALAAGNDGLISQNFHDPILAAHAAQQAQAQAAAAAGTVGTGAGAGAGAGGAGGLQEAPPPPAWSAAGPPRAGPPPPGGPAGEAAAALRPGYVGTSSSGDDTLPPPPPPPAPVEELPPSTAADAASLASQWQQMQAEDDDDDDV